MTKPDLDQLLSEAQLKLRNGYDDHLSRAVAEARDRLKAAEGARDDLLVKIDKLEYERIPELEREIDRLLEDGP